MGKQPSRDTDFIKLDNIQKLYWLADRGEKYSLNEISKKRYLRYLIELAIVDILVCNVDRHFRNFGFCYNIKNKKYEVPPIFDCGMGLFESDLTFRQMDKFEDCLRYCYIEPYTGRF